MKRNEMLLCENHTFESKVSIDYVNFTMMSYAKLS